MREVRGDWRCAESCKAFDVEEYDGLGEGFRLGIAHFIADVGEWSVTSVAFILDHWF